MSVNHRDPATGNLTPIAGAQVPPNDVDVEIVYDASNLRIVRYGNVIQMIFQACGIANRDNLTTVLKGYLPKVPTIGLLSDLNNSGQLYYVRLETGGVAVIITMSGSEYAGTINALGTLTFIADV